jgi:hypothetical protein
MNVMELTFKLRVPCYCFPVYYEMLLQYKSIILQKGIFPESLVLYVDVTDVPTSVIYVTAILVIFAVERSKKQTEKVSRSLTFVHNFTKIYHMESKNIHYTSDIKIQWFIIVLTISRHLITS